MKMIKLLVLSLVFSSGFSYGEEVLRLTGFSKQGVAYSSSLNFQIPYIPAVAAAGIHLNLQNSNRVGVIPKGLSHFLSENQNCEIRGAAVINSEENFDGRDDSISFKLHQSDLNFEDGLGKIPIFTGVLSSGERRNEIANLQSYLHSSSGLNLVPVFWGYSAEGLEGTYGALISALQKKGFHQNETDGEVAGFKYDYQALSQGSFLYLVEPLGGGGGGGGGRVVGVLLPQGHYWESDAALQAEIIAEPIQEFVKYGSVQDGSSISLPAVRCSQH